MVLPAPVSPVITFSPRPSASSALSISSRFLTLSSASTALRLAPGHDVAGAKAAISWAFVPTRTAFDVVVVGASISGCTAARLFALNGARVALVERRPDPDAYKVACTHAILSSAVPTMERIGLTALLDARGAVRTHPEVWTRHSGLIGFPTDAPHGYGVTRATLDPMVRALAADTPGVELLQGVTTTGLIRDGDRIAGVVVATPRRA